MAGEQARRVRRGTRESQQAALAAGAAGCRAHRQSCDGRSQRAAGAAHHDFNKTGEAQHMLGLLVQKLPLAVHPALQCAVSVSDASAKAAPPGPQSRPWQQLLHWQHSTAQHVHSTASSSPPTSRCRTGWAGQSAAGRPARPGSNSGWGMDVVALPGQAVIALQCSKTAGSHERFQRLG